MCDIANSPTISMRVGGHYIRGTLFKGAELGAPSSGRRRRTLFKGVDHGRRRGADRPAPAELGADRPD